MREELQDALPKPRLADVELLVSEIATNSVRHAGCDESGELAMVADVEHDRVRVRLSDRGRGFDVHTPTPRAGEAAGGYGLVLLERLSDRWGVQHKDGFSVWFEVQRERLPFQDDCGHWTRTA